MKDFIEFMIVIVCFFFWGSVFLFLLFKIIGWFNPDCRGAFKLLSEKEDEEKK